MYKLVVLSSVLALAAAKPSGILGLAGHALAGPLVAPWAASLAAPLAAPLIAPVPAPGVAPVALGALGVHGAPNYRGPLSLAPGQPASILAVDGRPLDTLSVNLDRAAHLTARAVDVAKLHLLKKRSAPLLTPALGLHGAAHLALPAAPLALPAAPFALSAAPLGLHAPLAPLGLGRLGHAAPLGHL